MFHFDWTTHFYLNLKHILITEVNTCDHRKDYVDYYSQGFMLISLDGSLVNLPGIALRN